MRAQSTSVSSSSSASAVAITPRAADYSAWYSDVIAAADLVDASPVKGCAILKPAGFAIWEAIRRDLDARLTRATGMQNAYFPLLVPTSFLSREAEHVEGFAKECAVVTHHRLRAVKATTTTTTSDGSGSGQTTTTTTTTTVEPDPAARLAEPLVIRPTSETLFWDAFSRWIVSYRDLPLVLNQWANVLRWELRTRPFLRTSEFLWQEGHTAHATPEEARAMARSAHAAYAAFLREVLAVPVYEGVKSQSERFAGADETLTCEALMQNGWALQAATSHNLGTHFSKAFGVMYTPSSSSAAAGGSPSPSPSPPPPPRAYVHGTSWGASTRLIGALIMSHSDDTGLVLPPAVAPTQVVVVGIGAGKKGAGGAPAERAAVVAACEAAASRLRAAGGLRVAVDVDLDTPPGSRFFHWERKGVPLRLEIGARDLAGGTAVTRDRLGGARGAVSVGGDAFVADVRGLLDGIQAQLYERALKRTQGTVREISRYEELVAHVRDAGGSAGGADGGDAEDGAAAAAVPGRRTVAAAASGGAKKGPASAPPPPPYAPRTLAFLAPWREDAAEEAAVKEETRYTIRCYPDSLRGKEEGRMCFKTGRPATHMALFARAF
jgi:prolyl-tRNA synthetase